MGTTGFKMSDIVYPVLFYINCRIVYYMRFIVIGENVNFFGLLVL
jgi:hypothetical protein